jgi:hypothetical protein
LAQVNDIVPADAWLYSMEAQTPEVLMLKGGANSQSAGLTLARKITEFVEVSQVKVNDLVETEPGRYEYTIEIAIDPALAAAPQPPVIPPAPAGGGAGGFEVEGSGAIAP